MRGGRPVTSVNRYFAGLVNQNVVQSPERSKAAAAR
jgi:hypothetical protein